MATFPLFKPLLCSASQSLIGCTPRHRPLSSRKRSLFSTDRFLDAQLGDLRTLQRQTKKIRRRLEQRIVDCLERDRSIDVFSAPILNDTFVQIQQIESLMSTVIHKERQGLKQAHVSRHQLLSIQGQGKP